MSHSFIVMLSVVTSVAMLSAIVLSVVIMNFTFFTVILSVVKSSIVLSVPFFYSYAECGYKCCYAERHCAECCHAECPILLLLC